MLEFTPPKKYTVYDPHGEVVARGEVPHEAPVLPSNTSEVVFDCQARQGTFAHARVTITTAGDVLAK